MKLLVLSTKLNQQVFVSSFVLQQHMKIMRLETSNHSLRIGMILSFLNLSSHDFVLGLLPQKSAYLTVYAYQLIIFPIFIRYGTLSAHSTILLSNKVLLSLPSNQDFVSFITLGHTPYLKHHLLWAQHTIFCLASTHTVKLEPSSDTTCYKTSWIVPYLYWYVIVHFRLKLSWFCL